MYVSDLMRWANALADSFAFVGNRYCRLSGLSVKSPWNSTFPTCNDISPRSPVNHQWQPVSSSANPISKLLVPCSWSTTSVTVPKSDTLPLSIMRVDHSFSCIVWCSSTKDCKTDDLPEALVPDRSVRGPSGRRSNSKHLKVLRSSRLITQYLAEHLIGHFKPPPHPVCLVGSQRDGVVEVSILQETIERR